MILYHRTTRKTAEAIKKGFKDGKGTYMTDTEFSGVWLSDVPLDSNEGASGDVLFEVKVNLPAPEMDYYEWVEEGKPYREWLIPAALLNAHSTFREISDAEVGDHLEEG